MSVRLKKNKTLFTVMRCEHRPIYANMLCIIEAVAGPSFCLQNKPLTGKSWKFSDKTATCTS